MRYHLSLGSNVGDRTANLRAALRALSARADVVVCAVSGCYETEPLEGFDQGPYLNLVAEIETEVDPLELVHRLKRIETELGRSPSARWGPRTIDIDIVLCGPAVIESERLTVPHRDFRNRDFVLTPLAEIAPDLVDPVSKKTVAELARQPGLQGRVVRRVDIDS
jgi:2-amino-4-hydroxy-6-hydroxymethyldihydropteridine diphosphokinase